MFVPSGLVEPDPRQTADVIWFGNQLRQARHRQQWSQRELGAATFFSREYVAMVERGLRTPSATFAERAGIALHAEPELRAAFARVQGHRQRITRRVVEGRRVRRRSRITVAAGRLRVAAASVRSPDRWAAFDELHQVLRDEIDPVDATVEVEKLEQRCADLVGDGRADSTWADVASGAALGFADAYALLQRPLCAGHTRRLETVARRFAVRSADALLMLGQVERAGQWLGLAEAVERRSGETQRPLVPESSSATSPQAQPTIDAPSRPQRPVSSDALTSAVLRDNRACPRS
ncbi:helix-turn-helix domain-containing protein [Dactylosporangium sp. McL0621]|uniref:helix-turn-helix domain-containing protein n=1 Tax=Dactylosporangium sp. McL0621 TaxID=3415678 RepID=UPI003CEE8C28